MRCGADRSPREWMFALNPPPSSAAESSTTPARGSPASKSNCLPNAIYREAHRRLAVGFAQTEASGAFRVGDLQEGEYLRSGLRAGRRAAVEGRRDAGVRADIFSAGTRDRGGAAACGCCRSGALRRELRSCDGQEAWWSAALSIDPAGLPVDRARVHIMSSGAARSAKLHACPRTGVSRSGMSCPATTCSGGATRANRLAGCRRCATSPSTTT